LDSYHRCMWNVLVYHIALGIQLKFTDLQPVKPPSYEQLAAEGIYRCPVCDSYGLGEKCPRIGCDANRDFIKPMDVEALDG